MAFNKKAFALSVVGTVTFLTILGSTAGTLAWYAYSTSTLLSYTGTSVRKSGLIGIGIVDKAVGGYLSPSIISRYDLEEQIIGEDKIVWTKSSNGLDSEVIKDYLLHSPYSYNKLAPVSTHSRAIDATTDLKLYRAPEFGKTSIDAEASTNDYVVLPFAFRVIDEHDETVKDLDIWLTDAVVEASAGQFINRAVRVHVKNDETQFIMNPSDDGTTQGATAVGGLLDLDGDGTYDYNVDGSQEYFYGEYDGTVSFAESEYGIDFDHAENINVNGTPYVDEASTFYAKHNQYAKIASFDTSNVKTVEYYPLGKVQPTVVDGVYTAGTTGIPISTTNHVTGIGYATLTVYLEGWDFSVIDKEIDHSFNLGLTFEINRI